MPSAVRESRFANPYVEELREQLAHQERSAVDWLVIAHNDVQLIQRLADALAGSSAAVLQLPQSSWDFEGQTLPAAIEWAVCETNPQGVVLAGHSQCSCPSEAARVFNRRARVAETLPCSPEASYERLLDGAEQVLARLQHAKEHLAAQVTHLCELPEVAQRLSGHTFQVHALFYIAEGGIFLVYDLPRNTFRPLTNTSCAA